MSRDDDQTFVYVGGWDKNKSPSQTGFNIYRYDSKTGDLSFIQSAFSGISVGATCVNAARNILYCVDECATLPGHQAGGGGQVYALSIDPRTGALTEINHRPSYGTLPTYVTVDPTAKYLVVTHHTTHVPITKVAKDLFGKYRIVVEYDDAGTVLFPLQEDGSIGEPCDFYRHQSEGGGLARQTHPQLHSAAMAPSGRFFVVCDKGSDELVCLSINYDAGKLEIPRRSGFKTPPGTLPRYSAFHPTRPYLFVNFEATAAVSAFRYSEDGRLDPICTVSALPTGQEDSQKMLQSDIRVHPSGKYLYTLIRGTNSVAAFEIDEATGAIERVQTVLLEGIGPRGCAVSPDGRFIHVATMMSDEVLVWAIDGNGRLAATGKRIKRPRPGTVTFFQTASR